MQEYFGAHTDVYPFFLVLNDRNGWFGGGQPFVDMGSIVILLIAIGISLMVWRRKWIAISFRQICHDIRLL
jgi:hypothetical protein